MEIQDILGYLLNSSAKLIKRSMDKYLEKYNITTAQWSIIKLLDSRERLTQTQISQELRADKATVGDIISRLIDKKLLDKSFEQKDRRAYSVCLTAEAKNIVKDIEEMAGNVTDAALKGLSDRQKEELYSTLNKIIKNLSEGE